MDDTIRKKIELVLIEQRLSKAELGNKLGISGQRIGHYLLSHQFYVVLTRSITLG
jgi:DNA-binding CsgD family transcriptional regulator